MRRAKWFGAGAILLGALFRGWHLGGRGLLLWDEGMFLLNARFIRWRWEYTFSGYWGGLPVPDGVSPYSESYPGLPAFLWKPFHGLFLALFQTLSGESIDSGRWFSCLCGIATLWAVYCLGSRLAGPWTGAWAALCLAVSSYHGYYSRLGLHEIDASLLAVLAVVMVVRSWQGRDTGKYLFFAGVFAMSALAVSYRLTVVILVIGLVEGLQWLLGRLGTVGVWPVMGDRVSGFGARVLGKTNIIKRAALFSAGGLLVLAVVEGFQQATIRPSFTHMERASYIGSLLEKFTTEGKFDVQFPLFFPEWLAWFDGPVPFLALAGLVVGAWRRKWAVVLPGMMTAVPLVLLSLTEQRLTRSITICLPFIAVLAGMGLAAMQESLLQERTRTFFTVISTLALVSWGVLTYHPLWYLTTPYQEALSWIESQGSQRHMATLWPVSAYLVGKEDALRLPQHFLGLEEGYRKGYRWVVVEAHKYVWREPSLKMLEERAKPVKIFSNPAAIWQPVLGENYLPQDLDGLPKWDPEVGAITIYDLQDVFTPSLTGD